MEGDNEDSANTTIDIVRDGRGPEDDDDDDHGPDFDRILRGILDKHKDKLMEVVVNNLNFYCDFVQSNCYRGSGSSRCPLQSQMWNLAATQRIHHGCCDGAPHSTYVPSWYSMLNNKSRV